jgi:hypothetical protein
VVERKHMQSCCCKGCELGDDDFNRADANPPTGSWYEISGNWAISGNKLIDNGGAGKLATTICHPVLYDKGSWRADFDLVECRTRSTFVVGAGDPGTSTYRVTFAFADMDTGTAKITVTIEGDETVSADYNWPGGYSSNDTVSVFVCYEPGGALRAQVKEGGFVPIYACVGSAVGDNCFVVSSTDVGGFFFVQGAFDNWEYEATAIDNLDCPACGCLCLKAYYPDNKYEPLEYSCFPQNLKAIFQLVTYPISGLTCYLTDFEVDLSQWDFGRNEWRSEIQTVCEGYTWQLIARCVYYEDPDTGLRWRTITLEILTSDVGVDVETMFYWTDLNLAIGDTTEIKWPDFDLSTCEPLSLVYKSVIPYITATSCYPDGGWKIFCCEPDLCGVPTPEVKWHVNVVPA